MTKIFENRLDTTEQKNWFEKVRYIFISEGTLSGQYCFKDNAYQKSNETSHNIYRNILNLEQEKNIYCVYARISFFFFLFVFFK